MTKTARTWQTPRVRLRAALFTMMTAGPLACGGGASTPARGGGASSHDAAANRDARTSSSDAAPPSSDAAPPSSDAPTAAPDASSGPPGNDAGALVAPADGGVSFVGTRAPLCVEGWCWEDPTPHGLALEAVWLAEDGEAWAVGERGLAMRRQGGIWSTGHTGVEADLHGLWGASAQNLWAVGDSGAVVHWDGARWSATTLGARPLRAIWGSGPDDIWAAGEAMWHWDGRGWTQRAPFAATTLWGSAADDVWAASGAGLHHYDGKSWTMAVARFEGTSINRLAGSAANDVWAIGNWGAWPRVLRFDGATWIEDKTRQAALIQALSSSSLTSLWVVSPNEAFVTALSAFDTAVARWDGARWTRQEALPGDPRALQAITVRGGEVAAVGTAGRIAARTAGAWRAEGTSTHQGARGLRSLSGSGPNDVWAVGDFSQVFHSDGGAWTSVRTPPEGGGHLYDVAACAPGDAWLVGDEGRTLRAQGAALAAVANDVPQEAGGSRVLPLLAVFCIAPNDVWAAGAQGIVSHWDGVRWTTTKVEGGDDWWDVWASGPRDVWLRGSHDRIARWDGQQWTVMRPDGNGTMFGTGARGLWGSGPNDVWAAWGGRLARWDGARWTLTNPLRVRAVRGIWGTAPDDVWVASDEGTLFHHDGATWRRVPAGSRTNPFVDVWAKDGHAFALAGIGVLHKKP